MSVGLAHLERFGAVLEPENDLARQASTDARHGVEVHDGGTMDLPEPLGIELVDELLEALADQPLAIRRDHPRVLRIGLEVAHLLDRDEKDVLPA